MVLPPVFSLSLNCPTLHTTFSDSGWASVRDGTRPSFACSEFESVVVQPILLVCDTIGPLQIGWTPQRRNAIGLLLPRPDLVLRVIFLRQ
jgi:hypothetical protein